jgi:raffinose/stachyose/melibiose transport system substrate-binding protein
MMKKSRKAAVLLITVMLLLGSGALVFAGGGAQAEGGGKVLEIRYMGTETVGGPVNELFTAMLEKFHKNNPDIKVQADLLPSTDLRTKITVEMAAGNPPEISVCIPSYAREFMRDNKIEDWRPIINANPEFQQWYDPKIINDMGYGDGRIMMLPTEAGIDGLFYNTEIFKKYGWQPPKTFDEFLDLAKKAKAAGITLMVVGGKDIRFAWLASALMARSAGKQKTDALTIGNAMDQWDNPEYGFTTAITKFKQLVDAGLYPRGVLGMSATEADQAFARGEAAMYYEGTWKVANFETAGGKEFVDKLERIDFPAFTDCPSGDPSIRIGGTLWGMMLPAGLSAEKKEAAIRFAKAYCDPGYNALLMNTGGRVYAGKCDYDRSRMSNVFNQCIDAYLGGSLYMKSMDTYAVPSVDLAIKQTAMPGIISGEFTVAQAVAEVNKAAKDYLASKK